MSKIKLFEKAKRVSRIQYGCFESILMVPKGILEKNYPQYANFEDYQGLMINYAQSRINNTKIEDIHKSLKSVYEICEQEITGIRPNDIYQWYDDPSEYCPYESILFYLNDQRTSIVKLDIELISWLNNSLGILDEINFSELFEGLKSYVKDDSGEFREATEQDKLNIDIHKTLEKAQLLSELEYWTDDLSKVLEICENKGDFKQIIKLIS